MARSYKKNVAGGNTTAPSEKEFKRKSNRKVRRANRVALNTQGEDFVDVPVRELVNVWDGPKDGKSFYNVAHWGDKAYKITGK